MSILVLASALAYAPPPPLVAVPGGRMVEAHCVHTVPSGTHVHDGESEFVFTHRNETWRAKKCDATSAGFGAGHGDAWKAWAQFKMQGSSSVTYLRNEWGVPSVPKIKEGQILYFWNGLEGGGDSGGNGVLQPVLQWTQATGWGIKSWYVGSGGTINTKLVATPAATSTAASRRPST